MTRQTTPRRLRPSNAHVILLAALALLALPAPARGQWTQPDGNNNVSNTNSGNVGVGTSSPDHKLQVFVVNPNQINVYVASFFRGYSGAVASGTSYGTGLQFRDYNSVQAGIVAVRTDIYNHYFSDLAFYVNGNGASGSSSLDDNTALAERMRIKSNGNVGIGTAGPAYRLDVQGGYTSSSSGFISRSNPWGTADSAFFPNGITTAGTTNWIYGSTTYINNAPSNGSGHQFQGANAYLAIGGGSVGVGTVTPGYRLDVAGPVRSSSGGFVFPDGTVQTTAAAGGGSQWAAASGVTGIQYSGGNVGVGTASPSVKLDVGGWAGRPADIQAGAAVNVGGDLFAGGGVGRLRASGNANEGFFSWNSYYNGSALKALDATKPAWLVEMFGGGGLDEFHLSRAAATSGAQSFSQLFTVLSDGNVGIGTNVPARLLDVQGAQGQLRLTSTGNTFGSVIELKNASVSQGMLGAVNFIDSAGSARGQVGYVTGDAMTFNTGGEEKMRLDASGNLTVTGNLSAKYQDVAEWVPSTQKLSAGTVVVLDAARTNHVVASGKPYDTAVAGVVSAEPGLILGVGGEGKLKVATTGRVKVKADATRSPIRVGDLLVTSDVEGVAMKSVPVDLGGTPIHRPGTIIGKALEPLEKGVGEILVLLSLQ
jgi:hypothetical protein